MSANTDVLREIANRMNAGDYNGLERFFTEGFVLHDVNAPQWPSGHDGVRRMLAGFAALGETMRLEMLDAVEDGDRVAVRWGVSWREDGRAMAAAIMAIYRFESGRIAEDWGISARAPWP